MTIAPLDTATELGVVAVTGNPRVGSRTARIAGQVARRLASELDGGESVVEVDLVTGMLDDETAFRTHGHTVRLRISAR